MPERTYRVLVVDDNPADLHLMMAAWSECRFEHVQVTPFSESRKIVPALRGAEAGVDLPMPDLIMVDYHMPLDGGMTIVELKGDPALLHIPLLVYTGSSNPASYLDCYRRGANACYQKPSELEEYISLVCHIAEHWLKRTALPPASGPIR
jgi:CheY-like chemotaxis protein